VSPRIEFLITGLLGLFLSTFGCFKVIKSGHFYILGTLVSRKLEPSKFWFIYFILGLLFCISSFCIIIAF